MIFIKNFDKEYDVEFLNQVIEYNHLRYLAYKNNISFEENKDFEKVLTARYMKVSRIKKRLIYLLSRCDYVWFCTFTFSNHYIDKSDRTKRDLIKSVISMHDFKYILNIDYGKDTEREHYHCIIGTNLDFNVNQFIQFHYPCHCLAIPCKKGSGDFSRLSKYINKLTNHCIKSTTKRQRILYNFKGYDNFCPTSKDVSLAFLLDKIKLFCSSDEVQDVSLLDKANITGKNLTQILHIDEDDILPPIIENDVIL